MRFALRNQNKIAKSLGQDYLDLLLSSLKEYFSKTEVPQEHKIAGVGSPVVFVPNVQKNADSEFIFVIVGKTYDVYRLAYYSAIG